MGKIYTSLGLMSGTSMDGVDASIIQTDGKSKYNAILDKYFEYPKKIYKNLTTLRDKIKSSKDLKKHQKLIKSVEKEITIFHAKAVNEILKKKKVNIDFIGFHGQTIFHNADEKTSRQLGDGKLLSKLTKKNVVYDFRQKDLRKGGHGAPLTPIFHKVLAQKFKITYSYFLNIGGITNYTLIDDGSEGVKFDIMGIKLKQKKDLYISANDIGPGMCLVDRWIRTNSKKKYDKDGKLAKSGKVDINLVEEALWDHKKIKKLNKKTMMYKQSFDVKDFDGSFVKGLSLKDGAATLIEFTVSDLIPSLHFTEKYGYNLVLCGGGRKNKVLVKKLKKFSTRIKLIDDYGIDGDFVESQAFAYLAIRSYLKLPISFPETTGCKKPCTGGVLVKNY